MKNGGKISEKASSFSRSLNIDLVRGGVIEILWLARQFLKAFFLLNEPLRHKTYLKNKQVSPLDSEHISLSLLFRSVHNKGRRVERWLM
jgi:hypothetical protein